MTSGSASLVPPIEGFGMPGTFVLREAEEAMAIRAFVQEHQCRRAVIAGGGLLGLEAGYALHKLGLAVSVLERGEWLLRRQLDERGSSFLRQYLEALGLDIVVQAETAAPQGDGRVSQMPLKDGRTLPCDLFLVAVGIQPNVELARAAGLQVNRGVVVDAAMRTSTRDVFAAGDVCEFEQQVPGLWPVAVEQARVVVIASPPGYRPDPAVEAVTQRIAAEHGGTITILTNPREAAAGANAIYTDVWVSMGQETEAAQRLRDLAPYQVNAELSVLRPTATKPNALIALAYVGAVVLTLGLIVLGVGLL